MHEYCKGRQMGRFLRQCRYCALVQWKHSRNMCVLRDVHEQEKAQLTWIQSLFLHEMLAGVQVVSCSLLANNSSCSFHSWMHEYCNGRQMDRYFWEFSQHTPNWRNKGRRILQNILEIFTNIPHAHPAPSIKYFAFHNLHQRFLEKFWKYSAPTSCTVMGYLPNFCQRPYTVCVLLHRST